MNWIPGILFWVGMLLFCGASFVFTFFFLIGQNGNLNKEGELMLYKSGFVAAIGAILLYASYRLNDPSLMM